MAERKLDIQSDTETQSMISKDTFDEQINRNAVKPRSIFSNQALRQNKNITENRPITQKSQRNRISIPLSNGEEDGCSDSIDQDIKNQHDSSFDIKDGAVDSVNDDDSLSGKKVKFRISEKDEEDQSPGFRRFAYKSPTKEEPESPDQKRTLIKLPRKFDLEEAVVATGKRTRRMLSPKTLKNIKDRDNVNNSYLKLQDEGYDSLSLDERHSWHDLLGAMKFQKDNYVDMERASETDCDLVQISFEEAIKELMKSFKFHTYRKSDIVCHKGAESDLMYIIIDGKVDIFIQKSKDELAAQLKLFEEKLDQFKEQKRFIRESTPQILNALIDKFPVRIIKELKESQALTPEVLTLLMNHQSFDFIKYDEFQSLGGGKYDMYLKHGFPNFKKLVTLELFLIFGELGVQQGQERAASCICGSDKLVLASLNKKAFEKVFSVNQKKIMEKKMFFEKNFIFHEDVSAIHKFLYNFDEKYFNPGQFLYKEGMPATHIYIVKKGNVSLLKRRKKYETDDINVLTNEDKQPGYQNEQKKIYMNVDIITENQFFNEEVQFDENNKVGMFSYMACSKPTIVYAITIENFKKTKEILLDLYDRMVGNIKKKIHARNERIGTLQKLEERNDPRTEIKAENLKLNGSLIKNSTQDTQVYNKNQVNITRDGNVNSGDFGPLKSEINQYCFDFRIPSKKQFFLNKAEPLSSMYAKRLKNIDKENKLKFVKMRQDKKHKKFQQNDTIEKTVKYEFEKTLKEKIHYVMKKREETQKFLAQNAIKEELKLAQFEETANSFQKNMTNYEKLRETQSETHMKIKNLEIKENESIDKLSETFGSHNKTLEYHISRQQEETPFANLGESLSNCQNHLESLTKAINATENLDNYQEELDHEIEVKSNNCFTFENEKSINVLNQSKLKKEESQYRQKYSKMSLEVTEFVEVDILKKENTDLKPIQTSDLKPFQTSDLKPVLQEFESNQIKSVKHSKNHSIISPTKLQDFPPIKINRFDKFMSPKASKNPSFFLSKQSYDFGNISKIHNENVVTKGFKNSSTRLDKNHLKTQMNFASPVSLDKRNIGKKVNHSNRNFDLSLGFMGKTMSDHSIRNIDMKRNSFEKNQIYDNSMVQSDVFLMTNYNTNLKNRVKPVVANKKKLSLDDNIRIKRNRFAFSKGIEQKEDIFLNEVTPNYKKNPVHNKLNAPNSSLIMNANVTSSEGIVSEKVNDALKRVLCNKMHSLNSKMKEVINVDDHNSIDFNKTLIRKSNNFSVKNEPATNRMSHGDNIQYNSSQREIKLVSPNKTAEDYNNNDKFPGIKDMKNYQTYNRNSGKKIWQNSTRNDLKTEQNASDIVCSNVLSYNRDSKFSHQNYM